MKNGFTRSFLWFSLLFNIFAEKKTYYAGIMLDAPSIVLCSKLCRHNVSDRSYRGMFTRQTVNYLCEMMARYRVL